MKPTSPTKLGAAAATRDPQGLRSPSKPPQSPKPREPRERDRSETTARILAAVGEVLARDGFGALGVNAVAKHAGVDKVLIYRFFGGMPELL